VALLVIWADRRFRLDRGRAFALYATAYTAGRFWIEYLRIDEAQVFAGLRLNDWTSLAVLAAAAGYLILSLRLRARRAADGPDAGEPDPEKKSLV
jgi:prolipoprotein diacylglyceryltransferase